MRLLNGSKVKDMVSIRSLLNKFNMRSVNQLNCQIKLLEIWKATHTANYPLQVESNSVKDVGEATRAACERRPIEVGKTNLTQKTSVSGAIRIWNLAPAIIKNCTTIYQAKKEIKKYAMSIPI